MCQVVLMIYNYLQSNMMVNTKFFEQIAIHPGVEPWLHLPERSFTF